MSELESKYPDFFRLAKDLRPMKKDFDYIRTKMLLLPDENITYNDEDKECIVADDVPLHEANLLTSRLPYPANSCNCYDGAHRIVLDIDHDAALIPSTTPGHHHLIINLTLHWPDYSRLLRELATAGVIEKGYAQAALRRGYTAIRTPWEKKRITSVLTGTEPFVP